MRRWFYISNLPFFTPRWRVEMAGKPESFGIMRICNKITAWIVMAAFFGALLQAGSAGAITPKEEEELGQQVYAAIQAHFKMVDDPMIVGYVNRLGNRIAAEFPPQPFTYRFYVVEEEVYNAFATPAGHVFMYTGLMAAMENEEELAGILAHEISHVYCRHISQKIERSKKINMAALAGLAAGIFLGAAGAGQAAGAMTMGTVAAGQAAELAFSREDEIQADEIGLRYLMEAGYSGEGLLTILNKIREKQWFGSDQVPSYLMTHPAVEARLAYIDTTLEKQKANRPKEPVNSEEFRFVRARIAALYGDETAALNRSRAAAQQSDPDAAAYYGYGLALARSGNRQQAVDVLQQGLALGAFNPHMLGALGRVYFLDGQYPQALQSLKGALSLDPDNAEALFYMGRVQMELGNLAEARTALEALLKQKPVSQQVHYLLGRTYGMQGNLAEAHYQMGVYHWMRRDFATARTQFQQALENNPSADRRREIEALLKKSSQAEEGEKKE
jgi:predicted Zn-dependent protease